MRRVYGCCVLRCGLIYGEGGRETEREREGVREGGREIERERELASRLTAPKWGALDAGRGRPLLQALRRDSSHLNEWGGEPPCSPSP